MFSSKVIIWYYKKCIEVSKQIFVNHVRSATILTVATFVSIMMVLTPAYSENNSGPSNAGAVSIVSMVVQPSTIRVGDNFTILATLANGSPDIINVHNDCLSPFSVMFDSHAKIEVMKPCIYFAISLPVNPGENRTGTSPGPNIIYKAMEPGMANVTITYSYTVGNQSGPNLTFASNPTSVSRSIMFMIYPPSGKDSVTLPPLEQIRSGIPTKDVKCAQGLQLVFKSEDGSPACVTRDTLAKLVTRGWTNGN